MAVTGDFKKAFLQVRVRPEEKNALIFHCLKNLPRALFGLAPPPFLLVGVIEHNLNDRSEKCPEIVSEIRI